MDHSQIVYSLSTSLRNLAFPTNNTYCEALERKTEISPSDGLIKTVASKIFYVLIISFAKTLDIITRSKKQALLTRLSHSVSHHTKNVSKSTVATLRNHPKKAAALGLGAVAVLGYAFFAKRSSVSSTPSPTPAPSAPEPTSTPESVPSPSTTNDSESTPSSALPAPTPESEPISEETNTQSPDSFLLPAPQESKELTLEDHIERIQQTISPDNVPQPHIKHFEEIIKENNHEDELKDFQQARRQYVNLENVKLALENERTARVSAQKGNELEKEEQCFDAYKEMIELREAFNKKKDILTRLQINRKQQEMNQLIEEELQLRTMRFNLQMKNIDLDKNDKKLSYFDFLSMKTLGFSIEDLQNDCVSKVNSLYRTLSRALHSDKNGNRDTYDHIFVKLGAAVKHLKSNVGFCGLREN